MTTLVSLGPATLRYHRRGAVCAGVMVLVCAALVVASVFLGEFDLHVHQVVDVLRGGGSRIERTVVVQWRLARCLVALAMGAALGIAGAITQTVARNGLASPDVLGISRGASVAAVVVLVVAGTTGPVGVPLAAMCGGLLTAGVIWLLSRGTGTGVYLLLLIGIGVSATLQAVTVYLLTATDLNTAAAAKVWMIGTVNGRTTEHLWPTLVVLVVATAALVRLSTHIPLLALGADTAQGLGAPVRRISGVLIVLAVVIVSVTVAAIGPVGFVAFVAPHIAARLARTQFPPVALAAMCGASLMAAADLIARTAFPWELPVGIVTAAVGGPFLLWLLMRKSLARLT